MAKTQTSEEMPKCRVKAHGYCKGQCDTCISHEVAEVIAMVSASDPKTAQLCLQELDFGTVWDKIPENLKAPPEDPFYCSILKTEVVVPCLLRSCPYWVDRTSAQNCLLCYYKEQEGNEELSTREIAEVLDYTVTETNSLLESAITALRHMAIGLPVGSQDLQATFEFVQTEYVCCVCERPTPEDLTEVLRIPELGLAYCSLACRVRKNPTVIHLEHKFHADIADILTWTLANFVKASAMEQALNMDSCAIQQLIRQFLGKNALSAFPGEKLPEAIQPFEALFSFNKLV